MNIEALSEQLIQQLAQINRRRSWGDAVLWLPRGLLLSLMFAAVLAAFSRFRPLFLNAEIAWLSILLGVLGIVLTAVVLLACRRRTFLEQARFADERLDLLERASTAVEIQLGHIQTTPALAHSQLSDTIGVYEKVDIRRNMPLQMRMSDIVLLAAVIILLFGAILLPNNQNDLLADNRLVKEEIERQVIALEALQEAISTDSRLSEESLDELLAPLEDAIEELREGDPSREFGVAVLSEAETELRELSAQNETSLADENLSETAAPLAQNQTSQELGQSLQRGQLSNASEELFQLSDQISALNENELSELARDLAETSANLQDIDPELAANLQRSAQALQAGDQNGGQEALDEAASILEQRAGEQALSSQAGQTADRMEESRQQIAQAGQNDQQTQDSDQPTANSGSSSDSGQGEGQGSGQALLGINGESRGLGGPGPGGGHVDQVFVPNLADISDIDGVNIELPAECSSNPDNCGSLVGEAPSQFSAEESLVPYSQVYGDYRDTAYETLDSEYIPLNMRSYIREYFSSLEP